MSEPLSVRTTVKGILVHNGRVLLNRCTDPYNGAYYSLPGGGQRKYETMAETLLREMREETGYTVRDPRFVGLFEEICDSEKYRSLYPDYCHKLYLFFLCSLDGDIPGQALQPDSDQLSCQWVPLEDLDPLPLQPVPLRSALKEMIQGRETCFLGSEHHTLPE